MPSPGPIASACKPQRVTRHLVLGSDTALCWHPLSLPLKSYPFLLFFSSSQILAHTDAVSLELGPLFHFLFSSFFLFWFFFWNDKPAGIIFRIFQSNLLPSWGETGLEAATKTKNGSSSSDSKNAMILFSFHRLCLPCTAKKVTLSLSLGSPVPCIWVYWCPCISDSALLLFSDFLMPKNPNAARKLYRSWPFAGGSSGSSHLLCSVFGSSSSTQHHHDHDDHYNADSAADADAEQGGTVSLRTEKLSFWFSFLRSLLVWWVSPLGRFLSGLDLELRPYLIYFYFRFINLSFGFNWTTRRSRSPSPPQSDYWLFSGLPIRFGTHIYLHAEDYSNGV